MLPPTRLARSKYFPPNLRWEGEGISGPGSRQSEFRFLIAKIEHPKGEQVAVQD
jgi:hypothetical protein